MSEKKLYYYNCFIEYNGGKTNININELLDRIIVQDAATKLKSIKQGNVSLMHIKPPDTNIFDHNDRKLVLGKFRDNKPFLGNIGTDRIDEIGDDVLEVASVFYRRNSRLLIIEYNHFGARPSAVQNYLSSFLPQTDDVFWSVQLEPIEEDLGFQDVEGSNDIKKVEFKIDLTARNRRIYLEEENESVLGDVLSKSIDTNESFGANIAYVGFGNGKKKRNVIDPEQIIHLLRGLDLDGDVFESVKVKYRSPSTGKTEEIDLKDQGVLKDIVDFENDGWEYTCDNLENQFYNNGRLGENNFRDYELQPARLPDLVLNNTNQ